MKFDLEKLLDESIPIPKTILVRLEIFPIHRHLKRKLIFISFTGISGAFEGPDASSARSAVGPTHAG
jgi:hypothetical protein